MSDIRGSNGKSGGAGSHSKPRGHTEPDPRDARVPAVLSHWNLAGADIDPVPGGHINRTYLVRAATGRCILQWVNPIFSPLLQYDIEAITARLEARGLVTPRLVRTATGELWVQDHPGEGQERGGSGKKQEERGPGEGQEERGPGEQREGGGPEDRQGADRRGDLWRLLTYVEGETVEAADSSGRCYQAGRLLGAFHLALWDFEYELQHGRFQVHDTAGHLRALERALVERSTHRAIDRVRPVAEAILGAAEELVIERPLKKRLVHGDPKISNLRFAPDGTAICLVDLDTINCMPIAVELGDALRSWCAVGGEERGGLDPDYFHAALLGYAEGVGWLPDPEEVEAIPALVEIIAVELAARFCADALNESYFGWDRIRFPSSCDHNLVRAEAQLSLARLVRQAMGELERINRSVWPCLVS
ncbi:MAG: aminoglycoside phosphotransferase family protein [Bradymonadales bacterium]|nr:aminoglycoside phosphotransferase family protein [Bradymonadales bacterium]